MKKLFFVAILFTSASLFGQTKPTEKNPTPDGINNTNPTPPDVVTDPNTQNNDTGIVTEPTKDENGNPVKPASPTLEGIKPNTPTSPDVQPNSTDNTGPSEVAPQ